MRVFYFDRTRVVLAIFVLASAVMLGWEGLKTFSGEPVPVLEPIYQGNTSQKAMALTINVDWGEDVLPGMLDFLAEEDIHCTFFITGRFASKFPDLVQEIDKRGHEIGNHGYWHSHPNNCGKAKNQEEITSTEKELAKTVVKPAKLFAPPYGECNSQVVEAASELGYQTIMWTIDTIDWQEGRTVDEILRKVVSRAQNGAIVLMHPKPVTLEALPEMVRELKEQGYTFKKVSEIILPDKSQNS